MKAPDVPFLDLARETAAVRPRLDAAAARVLDRGVFLQGPELAAFESAFSDAMDMPHAVGVASGLSAIELMLAAFEIGNGDEVIVPANTYIATWIAVSKAGAVPVPVEPDPVTRNVDVSRIPEAITAKTRAILAVHLYGQSAEMEELHTLAAEHGIPLLIDAAQSAGTTYNGSRRGTIGDAAAFSFYPTKNLGALADAGAVVTDNSEVADKIRLLRNYGMRDRFDHPAIGTNARMDEMTAAFLREKLTYLDEWNHRRAAIAERYLSAFEPIAEIELPQNRNHCWHLFVIQTPFRDKLQAFLGTRGINTAIHYPVPPHLSGAYAHRRSEFRPMPVTESLADSALSLPLSPFHTDGEIDRVIGAVHDFFAR